MVASGFAFGAGARNQQFGGGGKMGSKGILFGPAQASATQQVYQRNSRRYLCHVCEIFEDARPGLQCVRQANEERSRGWIFTPERVS